MWFEDEGWARDTAPRRPNFQRLLKLAEAGKVKWIVVAERDRFGTANADAFMYYRYLLHQWGCRLYDSSGVDWTGCDVLPWSSTRTCPGRRPVRRAPRFTGLRPALLSVRSLTAAARLHSGEQYRAPAFFPTTGFPQTTQRGSVPTTCPPCS